MDTPLSSADKKRIDQALKDGAQKHELLLEFSTVYDQDILRRHLASRPTKADRYDLRFLNPILLVLLVPFILVEILGHIADFEPLSIVQIAVSIYIAFRVRHLDGDIYLPSMIWAVFGILNLLRETGKDPSFTLTDPLVQAILIWMVGIAVVSWMIRRIAFSHYDWFKPRKDSSGNYLFE